MSKFIERLNKLLEEENLSDRKLANVLGISSSPICNWKKGKQIPTLENAVKIADYFNCSLDYLFGLVEIDEKDSFLKGNFNLRLKKILKDKKLTQKQLNEATGFNNVNTNGWLNKNVQPDMPTVIRLAEYLNVSLDYLAGRE